MRSRASTRPDFAEVPVTFQDVAGSDPGPGGASSPTPHQRSSGSLGGTPHNNQLTIQEEAG